MENKTLDNKCLISTYDFLTSFKNRIYTYADNIECIIFDINDDIHILNSILKSNTLTVENENILKEIQYVYHNELMRMFEIQCSSIFEDEKKLYLDGEYEKEKSKLIKDGIRVYHPIGVDEEK